MRIPSLRWLMYVADPPRGGALVVSGKTFGKQRKNTWPVTAVTVTYDER